MRLFGEFPKSHKAQKITGKKCSLIKYTWEMLSVLEIVK